MHFGIVLALGNIETIMIEKMKILVGGYAETKTEGGAMDEE